jgi:hypothetical protein
MEMRVWQSPDGINWVIDIDLPGSSNAMVIFRHPGHKNGRLDKYNWFISNGPEARSVTSRLTKAKVLEALTDVDLAKLYKRAMNISRPDPLLPAEASNG